MRGHKNSQYAIALYQATKGLTGKKLDSVIGNFISLLVNIHKLKLLDKIVAEFVKYAKKQQGIKDIEITSARELDKKTLAEVKKIFDEHVVSTEKINKNLLGGFVIKTDELILDASLKTQLTKLKQIFQ